jgi:hypothetical protein
MRIGILGSGLMGGKLGTLFARAGHVVVFSYSQSEEKLSRLAHEAGPTARAGSPLDAAQGSDVLLLAVYWSRVGDVLREAGDLSGRTIVTCSLPMNGANTELVLGHTTSGAEALAKRVPGAHVVSAFNTIPSEVLFGVYAARGKVPAPSMLYCGDDPGAKDVAAALIQDLGFEAIDVGPLASARYTEPLAMVIAHMAYDGEGGPELAYRIERFGRGE